MVRCALLSILSLSLMGCCAGARPKKVSKTFSATDEDVAQFLRTDGTLEPDACMELCEERFGIDVEDCEVVDHDPELTRGWLFECSGEQRAVCF
jgi:hypothetical protein